MGTYDQTTSAPVASGSTLTLTAFFDERDAAAAAVGRLTDIGIAPESVRFVASDGSAVESTAEESKGFWAKLEDFFFPDEDREIYSEGLRRGGYLVTVTDVEGGLYEDALDILDDEGSVDLTARAESWRAEGWDPVRDQQTEDAFDAPRTPTATVDDGSVPFSSDNSRLRRDFDTGRARARAYKLGDPAPQTDPFGDATDETSPSETDSGEGTVRPGTQSQNQKQS